MYFGAFATREKDACPECGDTYVGWSNGRQGYYCPRHQESPGDRIWSRITTVVAALMVVGLYLLPFVLLGIVLRLALG